MTLSRFVVLFFTMKKLTHQQFADTLAARKGAIILGIVACTDPKARKTGNPFHQIRKLTHTRVVTGADYTKAVEKQGGEGFKADALPYGEEVVKGKIIRNKQGELQLRTVFRNAPKPISVHYIADGKPVDKKEIEDFLPERKDSAKQAAVGVVGKKQVQVRNFGLKNIQQVRINGEVFELIP